MAELRRLGVKIITGATATEIVPEGIRIVKEGSQDLLPADSVIMATGSRPENGLLNVIKGLAPEVYVIGDAVEPQNALEAIKDGFLTGLKI